MNLTGSSYDSYIHLSLSQGDRQPNKLWMGLCGDLVYNNKDITREYTWNVMAYKFTNQEWRRLRQGSSMGDLCEYVGNRATLT